MHEGFLDAAGGSLGRPARRPWLPGRRESGDLNLATFIELIRLRFDDQVADYRDLHQWSVEQPEEFWLSVWLFCDIRAHVTWDEVLGRARDMRSARWFSGARLNFAENLLAYRDDTEALVCRGADGERRAVSFARLRTEVAALAAAFRRHGIRPGDRIAAIVDNRPEAVVAMLAAASVGAVWASLAADSDAATLFACFGQIAPRILVDFRRCRGDGSDTIAARLPGLELVVGTSAGAAPAAGDSPTPVTTYAEFIAGGGAGAADYVALPFDFPLTISFADSGAEKPNCVVHGAGGTLIQHLKELVLHVDMRRPDRVVAVVTPGEMLWQYMVSTLATGASLILIDAGSAAGGPAALRQAVSEERATMLGAGAGQLDEILRDTAGDGCRLDSLRTLLAYGDACPSGIQALANRRAGRRLRVCRMLTRPDIHSCLALGIPLPATGGSGDPRCGLGMKLEILDAQGRAVRGGAGMLACTAPFPALPIVVWQDFSGEKYRNAYFRQFPGAWSQGDRAEITADGGLIFHRAGIAGDGLAAVAPASAVAGIRAARRAVP